MKSLKLVPRTNKYIYGTMNRPKFTWFVIEVVHSCLIAEKTLQISD